MEPAATSEQKYSPELLGQGCQNPPKPWSLSQQQGDRQFNMGALQSCYSRGGSWPLQPEKLLCTDQLRPLPPVFTNFKQINLNAEQRSWRWYLGRFFVVALLFFPLFPVRLKLEVEGVWMIFFTSLLWVVTFPPAQVGPSLWGSPIPLHTLCSSSHKEPRGI